MSGSSLLEQGETCYQRGEYDRAVELLREALNERRDKARGHYFLGLSWFEERAFH
jgi:tetratricopeptide (TPR) repeat protein